jgi:hypothetical protein
VLLLSAADVDEHRHDDALALLDERPGLREAFEAQRHEVRPDRRTLYFDAAAGWRFVDLCDLCGTDLGTLEEEPLLVALCEDCHDEQDVLERDQDRDLAQEMDLALAGDEEGELSDVGHDAPGDVRRAG